MPPTLAPRLLLALLAARAAGALDERNARGNVSSMLEASLRRQLMADNYDYTSSESVGLPARHKQEAQPPAPPPPPPHSNALLPFVNEIYIPRAAEPSPPPPYSWSGEDSAPSPRGHGVGALKSDLLYYMDDGLLTRRVAPVAPAAPPEPPEPPASDLPQDSTPKLKYKVLKVKVPGARRAGAGGYQRFLQEEGEGGVAIINLGDEPFPEFRLPSARRQYMAEEPLPLPSDLEGEPPPPPPPPPRR